MELFSECAWWYNNFINSMFSSLALRTFKGFGNFFVVIIILTMHWQVIGLLEVFKSHVY